MPGFPGTFLIHGPQRLPTVSGAFQWVLALSAGPGPKRHGRVRGAPPNVSSLLWRPSAQANPHRRGDSASSEGATGGAVTLTTQRATIGVGLVLILATGLIHLPSRAIVGRCRHRGAVLRCDLVDRIMRLVLPEPKGATSNFAALASFETSGEGEALAFIGVARNIPLACETAQQSRRKAPARADALGDAARRQRRITPSGGQPRRPRRCR
jgi:hypothetical protein